MMMAQPGTGKRRCEAANAKMRREELIDVDVVVQVAADQPATTAATETRRRSDVDCEGVEGAQ